ncbi:MAG: hypothetical protein BZY80_04680 [SAR202 cluster bacterium Io17-Chloro-G2]|nr:MAG: hypothetical protein BZY80_04680 [SAR202 cluster bacterium Io17-Chloro-G2]
MADSGFPGFIGGDAPSESDLYRCVHCGLCLSACPTYLQTGLETESPRGRLALMKAVNEGRLAITGRVVAHWDLCLQCRACEAVCPSGVPYGWLMENARAQVLKQGKRSAKLNSISRLFLRSALPHPGRLKLGAHLIRLYQRWGIQGLVRRSRILNLLPGHVSRFESNLPVMGSRFFAPSPKVYPSLSDKKLTVGLLSGCVMPLVQGATMDAAVRVLNRNGCEVAVPVGQGCCGALNAHSGDLDMARSMARKNIDVFLAAGVEQIVVASAGCSATMKEYPDLFAEDVKYREKAVHFSQLTMDITEFLASLPWEAPKGQVNRRVTYQDPCHLANAQGITSQPRAILKSIPGVELVEMEQSSVCCGGAGIYSTVQEEMSGRVLDTKMTHIAATQADQVVTANPGCMIQINQGLANSGISGGVCHVVDILDEAYRGESQD